ncbi:MAG TPA: hypothetical protein VM940_07275 [Chthoniobacterales bacterium]|nr:hypothetical protein [Chthoniobacterales bacterium]
MKAESLGQTHHLIGKFIAEDEYASDLDLRFGATPPLALVSPDLLAQNEDGNLAL